MSQRKDSISGLEVLIQEADGGWSCLGALSVTTLLRSMESRDLTGLAVYDSHRERVVGMVSAAELRKLLPDRAAGPLRVQELELLLNREPWSGTPSTIADSGARGIVVLGKSPRPRRSQDERPPSARAQELDPERTAGDALPDAGAIRGIRDELPGW